MEMQKHIDKEKIQEDRARFKNYQREYERKIREADNERLKGYYKEFANQELNPDNIQGALKFLMFMLNK